MNPSTPSPTLTQPVSEFTTPSSEETLQHVAENIRARNIEVIIVEDGVAAKELVLKRIPQGAELHTGKSKTLQDSGLFEALHNQELYNPLRPRYMKMDRKTQAYEMRKLIASPDYILGSLNAITEDGILVAASATSNQLGPYANTAGKVIFVVGSQKIVPNMEAALRRIHDYILPWEDEQVRKVLPSGSFVGKILMIERESVPERMTVVLVRQPIGI
jgi:L-lactate utilization protein LutC